MDEKVGIGLNMRRTEKQKGLEERISWKDMFKKIGTIFNPYRSARLLASGKSIIKRFGDIFNPLRSARLLASNVSSERNPLFARTLYGVGLGVPLFVIVSGIGMVGAGVYGVAKGIEKYVF